MAVMRLWHWGSRKPNTVVTLPYGDDPQNQYKLPVRKAPPRHTYKIKYAGQKGAEKKKGSWLRRLFWFFVLLFVTLFTFNSRLQSFLMNKYVLRYAIFREVLDPERWKTEEDWKARVKQLELQHAREIEKYRDAQKEGNKKYISGDDGDVETALANLREEMNAIAAREKKEMEERIHQLSQEKENQEQQIVQLTQQKEENEGLITQLKTTEETLRAEHAAELQRRDENRAIEIQTEVDKARGEIESSWHNENRQKEEEMNKLQLAADSYKTKLHQNIKDLSRKSLLEKYGPGPHMVEVQLEFNPASNVAQGPNRFVLQLAPVDELPHVVYWFLEQVSHRLYEGTSFHTSLSHIIQGGPNGDEELVGRFRETGLDQIYFQEYSHSFPHEKYTLGYAGRPGGLEFYISMHDNTVHHGPGGQGGRFHPEEADPCFAKIIEGFDVVDRMNTAEVGDRRALVYPVIIRHMTLLNTSQ